MSGWRRPHRTEVVLGTDTSADCRRAVEFAVREAVLRDADLFGADESFLTSTTREVVPIVQVDDQTIGRGRPGPITQALLQGYRRKAQALTRPQAGVRN